MCSSSRMDLSSCWGSQSLQSWCCLKALLRVSTSWHSWAQTAQEQLWADVWHGSTMLHQCSRAWTEKMMRHATTEETLEISLELMTSPKLCQFTASLLTLLTLLLLWCSLVFCVDLHRSSASESSIIKWESLCWSGLSTVIQLSAAHSGTLCDWLDMIWQQKSKGRTVEPFADSENTPKTRPWPCSPQPEPYQCSSCKESVRERERERVSKKWSI